MESYSILNNGKNASHCLSLFGVRFRRYLCDRWIALINDPLRNIGTCLARSVALRLSYLLVFACVVGLCLLLDIVRGKTQTDQGDCYAAHLLFFFWLYVLVYSGTHVVGRGTYRNVRYWMRELCRKLRTILALSVGDSVDYCVDRFFVALRNSYIGKGIDIYYTTCYYVLTPY